MYYYGARYYEPRLGLWISCEPEEENYPTFNSYCYTANNPIRYIDTDGENIEALPDNRKSYTYGTTLQGNGNSNDSYGRKVDKNGKYGITSATITIFEGTLIEDAKTSNPKHK